MIWATPDGPTPESRELTEDERKWIKAANRVMKRQPKTLRLVVGYGGKAINVIDNASGPGWRAEDVATHPDAQLGEIKTPASIMVT